MDGSKGQPHITAGLDLGDKYSYLCLIDTQSAEVIEEGKLRTTPEALRRRFNSERQLRVAIEAGTHSPWVRKERQEASGSGGGEEALCALAPPVWVTAELYDPLYNAHRRAAEQEAA